MFEIRRWYSKLWSVLWFICSYTSQITFSICYNNSCLYICRCTSYRKKLHLCLIIMAENDTYCRHFRALTKRFSRRYRITLTKQECKNLIRLSNGILSEYGRPKNQRMTTLDTIIYVAFVPDSDADEFGVRYDVTFPQTYPDYTYNADPGWAAFGLLTYNEQPIVPPSKMRGRKMVSRHLPLKG